MPKWTDWFNDAEILLEFRNDTANITIQSGIHIAAQSWMTEMNRANETMGQGTWFWNNTDYLNYVNETESFVTQERTNQSHYSREYGVVVNDTIVLDVIVDVKDHWTVEHGFSYLDLNTGVRDYMSVETEAH